MAEKSSEVQTTTPLEPTDTVADDSLTAKVKVARAHSGGNALKTAAEGEQKKGVRREYIKDDDGRIIDIMFSENGKSISLKKVLPGNYTIEFISGSDVLYDPLTDNISYGEGDDSEGEQNLSILHEAGHAVDRPQLLQAMADHLTSIVCSDIYLSRAQELVAFRSHPQYLIDYGSNREAVLKEYDDTIKREIEDYTGYTLEEVRSKMGNDLYDSLRLGLIESIDHAFSVTDDKEAYEKHEQYEKLKKVLEYEKQPYFERNAWVHALLAYRKLKAAGITLYEGDYKTITGRVEYWLSTYQEGSPSHVKYMSNKKQRAVLSDAVPEAA